MITTGKNKSMKKSIYPAGLIIFSVFFLSAVSVHAQPVAVDDDYGVPFGEPLVVENPGVLGNDTGGAAAAASVTGPSDGLLECVGGDHPTLCDDGSFTYTPGSGFTGSDTFTYVANDGAGGPDSNQATVTLTACTDGPDLFSCWKEASYLAKLGELGYGTFQEGFENVTAWGSVRSPNTAASVTSLGIKWETNYPDSPAFNEITTGSGPARTGLWGIYDLDHGYATGTPAECDIDIPPAHCLYHDGFTGIRVSGQALHGAGGFITGFTGASIALILDGTNQIGLGKLPGPGHHFFGVIDDSPDGFTEFEFRELDGKVGQTLLIFGDDFTFASFCVTAGDCDDANVCTDDDCVSNVCEYTNNTAPCDDSFYCNGTDTCSAGNCSHAGNPCPDDGLFCNGVESCDEVNDQCTQSGDPCPPDASCNETTDSCECLDDGFFCNGFEFFAFDQCLHSGDPCFSLLCDEGTDSCVECFVNADCDDSDVCTDDVCTGGVCQHTNNTEPCDDGLYCTGTDTCSGGNCVHGGDPCIPLVCFEETDECRSGDIDSDGDGILDGSDNCPETFNPGQEDNYPPGGNNRGDACECEGNFDCDQDCDGTDASTFKIDFGRSSFENPCNSEPVCNGNFDCDLDVDGTDAALFKSDFGRSTFENPCPTCVVGTWCIYP
jgi:hypothetical protein